jgi:hypothetical protein
MECFGSYTDWAQGSVVYTLDVKGGKLSNVYLINACFTSITSNYPGALGIQIGEVDEKGKFTPFSQREIYVNAEYNTGENIETYHYIIPPKCVTHEPKSVYRSTSNVNNSYGMTYTHLTEDERDIARGCQVMGQTHRLVPVRSPITQYIFEEAPIPAENLPKRSVDDDNYFKVPNNLYMFAVSELKKIIRMFLPVHDLNKLALRAFPLLNGPASALFYQQEQFEREKVILDLEQAAKGLNSEGTSARLKELKNIKGDFGLCFTMDWFLMFRDYAEESMDKEDEEEEEEED